MYMLIDIAAVLVIGALVFIETKPELSAILTIVALALMVIDAFKYNKK